MIGQLIGLFIISIAVGVGASRVGYSGLIWFVAMFFGGPFTLGLVSALPDRELDKKRSRELASLRLELESAHRIAEPGIEVPEQTIGGRETIRG
jgi:hypothetical protein